MLFSTSGLEGLEGLGPAAHPSALVSGEGSSRRRHGRLQLWSIVVSGDRRVLVNWWQMSANLDASWGFFFFFRGRAVGL